MVDTEDPIEVGGETAYEIRITNTGSKTETDIKLVATMPDKMEFKNAQGPVHFHEEGTANRLRAAGEVGSEGGCDLPHQRQGPGSGHGALQDPGDERQHFGAGHAGGTDAHLR